MKSLAFNIQIKRLFKYWWLYNTRWNFRPCDDVKDVMWELNEMEVYLVIIDEEFDLSETDEADKNDNNEIN